jgi:hypothetical protein
MNIKREFSVLAQFTVIALVASEVAFEMYLSSLPDYGGWALQYRNSIPVSAHLWAQWNRFDRWVVLTVLAFGLIRIGLIFVLELLRRRFRQ